MCPEVTSRFSGTDTEQYWSPVAPCPSHIPELWTRTNPSSLFFSILPCPQSTTHMTEYVYFMYSTWCMRTCANVLVQPNFSTFKLSISRTTPTICCPDHSSLRKPPPLPVCVCVCVWIQQWQWCSVAEARQAPNCEMHCAKWAPCPARAFRPLNMTHLPHF